MSNSEKDDCIDWIGGYSSSNYQSFCANRVWAQQRIGQAWFNVLTREDQEKLRGTLWDPFYSDSWTEVYKALLFLLKN